MNEDIAQLALSSHTYAALTVAGVTTISRAKLIAAIGKGAIAELQKALRRYEDKRK